MKYSGMTVNERLYFAGLIEKFDNAIRQHDFEQAVQILMQTELTSDQAHATVETIQKNPKKYGY